MKRLPIAAAVALATLSMTASMSSHAVYYQKDYSTVTSTPLPTASPKPIVTTVSLGTSNTFYTNPTAGGASVSNAPAIQLIRDGDWHFDFTDLNHVTFTGAINYGNYETQTNANALISNIYGHIVFTGVKQSFSGVGVYNDATNTFTYTYAAGASNSGGGSVYSQTAAATCKSVGTALGNNVCSGYAASTPAWEGLSLNFVFDENRNNFTGKIIGTEKSTVSGATTTTLTYWNTVGTVPVPAAAWLFGSALVGLAGIKRRKA